MDEIDEPSLNLKLDVALVLLNREGEGIKAAEETEETKADVKRAMSVARRLFWDVNEKAMRDGWTYEDYAAAGAYLVAKLLGRLWAKMSQQERDLLLPLLSDFAKERYVKDRGYISTARLHRARVNL